MLGCSWGLQGLEEAAFPHKGCSRGHRASSPGGDRGLSPPLLFAEAFKSFGLVGQSRSFSLGSLGWEPVTWHSSGASQPAAVIMGWGMDLGTAVPLVQLCRRLGNAVCKPRAGSCSLPGSPSPEQHLEN